MEQKRHLNKNNKWVKCEAKKRGCRYAETCITETQYKTMNTPPINTPLEEKVKQLENWGISTGTTGLKTILPKPNTIRKGINTENHTALKQLDEAAEQLKDIPFTSEEKQAMRFYTFIGNRHVNAYLWGGEKGIEAYALRTAPKDLKGEQLGEYLDEEIPKLKTNASKTIATLDEAFNKILQTNTPKVLYRGFYLPKDYIGDVTSYIKETFKEGNVYEPKTYLSTSADSDLMLAMSAKNPQRFFILEIATKKDGLILHKKQKEGSNRTSIQQSEREILLPRDLKFKIENITNATYETTYESGRPSGFFFEKRIPKKKRFQVIQLVEE